MDTQPILNCCPKCRASLPPDAPQGLCPKCLLAAVATPTEAGQSAGHRPTPPPLADVAAAFPQLEILEFFGQGGMGFVFKARQPKLDRLVALKILPQSLAADPTFAGRFNREARLLARLNHPGIVTVHDFGVASSQSPALNPQPFYYLLMEFVDGVNLRQAMQAGRFTPDQAMAIVPRICEALQFAHNEGILHRDIKPENILLDAKGRVKIADFGIAKLVAGGCERRDSAGDDSHWSQSAATGNFTEAGKTLGTPDYMAPEQLERPQDVDHRADIYSLGVVFYEMLTGELPLGRFAPPSRKSAVDPRMDEVVLRALEMEKTKRHASADEVRTQVETIVAGQSSIGVPPAKPGGAPKAGFTQAEFDKMSRDPANWHFYFIYFCRRDPRIIVMKRITGLGWTINFGKPLAVPFGIGSVVLAMGIIKVARLVGLTGNALLAVKLAVVVIIVWMCHKLSMSRNQPTGVPPAAVNPTGGRGEQALRRGGIVLVGRRNGQRVIVWRGVANTFVTVHVGREMSGDRGCMLKSDPDRLFAVGTV